MKRNFLMGAAAVAGLMIFRLAAAVRAAMPTPRRLKKPRRLRLPKNRPLRPKVKPPKQPTLRRPKPPMPVPVSSSPV